MDLEFCWLESKECLEGGETPVVSVTVALSQPLLSQQPEEYLFQCL